MKIENARLYWNGWGAFRVSEEKIKGYRFWFGKGVRSFDDASTEKKVQMILVEAMQAMTRDLHDGDTVMPQILQIDEIRDLFASDTLSMFCGRVVE